MTREEIVKLFDHRQEAMDRQDVDALTALYAPDCVVESPMAGSTVRGRAAVAHVYHTLFEAFPDLTYTPDDLVIEGDVAVQIAMVTGTDTGGFMGMPPSGRPVRVPVTILCRFSDGGIAHERRIYDFTGMLVQAGVLKARPA
jgi:steroid delta-isomerase-like uncharacterized protein